MGMDVWEWVWDACPPVNTISYSKTCRETTMPVLPDNTGSVIDSRGSCVPIPWIPLYLITEISWKLKAI